MLHLLSPKLSFRALPTVATNMFQVTVFHDQLPRPFTPAPVSHEKRALGLKRYAFPAFLL